MRIHLALALVLLAVPAAAQLSSQGLIEIGGARGGRSLAIAHFGDHAYVAAAHVLNVLDATDPTDLTLVRSVSVEPIAGGNPPLAVDVAVDDASEMLFVAMQDDGLWVFSLQDPAEPTLLERRTNLGAVHGLDKEGDKLFAFTDEGAVFFSLSDPANSSPAGILRPNVLPISLPVEPRCHDVTRSNGYVYTMWNRRDFDPPLPQLIIYPDEPTGEPSEVASALYFQNPGDGDVIVNGNTVLFACGFRTVLVSTFTEEGGLQYVTSSSMPAVEIIKIGFFLHAFQGLTYNVYYVVDPANPVLLESVSLSGAVQEARLVNGRVWVATENTGVEVYAVSSTTGPQRIGHFWYPSGPSDMEIQGDKLYLSDNQLMVLDIGVDAQNPPVSDIEVVGSYYGLRSALSVNQDAVAYVPHAGLLSVDLSDPATSSILGQIQFSGQNLDVTHEGDLVYAASTGRGFAICDFSDPEQPELLYESTGLWGEGLDVWAGHLFLAGTEAGKPVITVFDVSDPRAPVQRAQVLNPGGDQDVKVSQGHLYTAGFGGTAIFDVRDPGTPVLRATIPTDYRMLALDVSGNQLVVGDDDVVRVYDVSDRSNPVETGFHEMPGYVKSIVQRGPVVYVGVSSSGVHTLLGEEPTGVSTPRTPSIDVSARPNPMSSQGTLSFRLGRDDVARVELFNAAGRRVRAWTRRAAADVPVLVVWDGRDGAGRTVASGTYFYRVVTSREKASGRIVLVR